MELRFNFGTLSRPMPPAKDVRSQRFRIAVLGDFSCRANARRLETGEALAHRKPIHVDVDNLDQILDRLSPRLRLAMADGSGVLETTFTELDDFHPDSLYRKLDVFAELANLRRRLQNPSTYAAAVEELTPWIGNAVAPAQEPADTESRSAAIPEGDLDDFAKLIGMTSPEQDVLAGIEQLARQWVAPYVVPSPDPAQAEMIAAADTALSAAMRAILHHPDFRAAESIWRSVELLARRLETNSSLQIVLYDITAEEIAADLGAVEELDQSGLYKLLVEHPAADATQGPLSLLLGMYRFSQQPGHVDLLGRMAKIAAAAHAPFVAGLKAADPADAAAEAGLAGLRGLPEAKYVALTYPRYLQRMPYEKRTSPIDSFDFQELVTPDDTGNLLWGNSATLIGVTLGQAFARSGWRGLSGDMQLAIGDLPFYWYTDQDGDQFAVPCAEVPLPISRAESLAEAGIIPVLGMQGAPELRLAGLRSVAGPFSFD